MGFREERGSSGKGVQEVLCSPFRFRYVHRRVEILPAHKAHTDFGARQRIVWALGSGGERLACRWLASRLWGMALNRWVPLSSSRGRLRWRGQALRQLGSP